ncbi:MAG TPA: RagB/SusD family nutrient uptake outer membrane protein, partial [Porphyromonadaceae bacterium]|nr:RagB/SusD family nutrient uptake outer membrane protein [Porphyromonadaceae bacterium]
MKKIIYLIVFSFTVLTSCDLDDYLNKTPLDSITDVDYWKSASDLQLYVNQFYTMLPQFPSWGGGYLWEDNNSDNMASRFYDNRLAGTNTITTNNGSWDYSRIRSINIMLNKYKEMSVSESEIAPYVGEAYFFRAFAYFNLVRQYGDVPYVSQVLTPDSEELFAARTPRKEVIDYILDDLSQAIEKLPPKAA